MTRLITNQSMQLYAGLSTWTYSYGRHDLIQAIALEVPQDSSADFVEEGTFPAAPAQENGGQTTPKRAGAEKKAHLVLHHYTDQRPEFSSLRFAFLNFTYIHPESAIWQSYLTEAFRPYYRDYLLIYTSEDYEKLAAGLHPQDCFDVVMLEDVCFGSLEIEGTQGEEEVKTSSGTFKFPKRDRSFEARLTGYLERFDARNEETAFSRHLLQGQFDRLYEGQDRMKELYEAKSPTFWFYAFLMPQDDRQVDFEASVCFRGTLHTAKVQLSVETQVQEFSVPIAVQSRPFVAQRDFRLEDLFV